MPDFFTTLLLSTPLPQATRDQAMAVIQRAERAMPWVGSLQGPAGLIFNQGRWPMPTPAVNVTSDAEQQRQWKAFVDAYSPITKAVAKGAMADALAEGQRLQANEAFWNTVYRVDLALATTGLSEVGRLWDTLKGKMSELKAARAATKVALDATRAAVTDPKYAAALASQQAQLAQLEAANAQVGAEALSSLGPIANISGVKEDLGLAGVEDVAKAAVPWLTPAKLVAAGIAAGVLVAITAAFIVHVNRQAEIQKQANQLASDTLTRRDAVNEQLFREGKLTATQYAQQQEQNAKDVAVVRQANEQASLGSNLGKYLGIAAVVAGVGLAIYFIMKGRRGGSAPPR
jgi:hypothetical protein